MTKESMYQLMSLINLLGCLSAVVYCTWRFLKHRRIFRIEDHRTAGWMVLTCVLVSIGQVWSLTNPATVHWLLKFAGVFSWASLISFTYYLEEKIDA